VEAETLSTRPMPRLELCASRVPSMVLWVATPYTASMSLIGTSIMQPMKTVRIYCTWPPMPRQKGNSEQEKNGSYGSANHVDLS